MIDRQLASFSALGFVRDLARRSAGRSATAVTAAGLLAALGLVLHALPPAELAHAEGEGNAVQAVDFTDHGVPAPVARHRGVAAAETPDGRSVILAWLSARNDASLLVIDVESGQTQQFKHEQRVRGRSFLLTDAGQFYAYGDSQLLVYDLHTNELDVIEGPGRFGYAIVEADDGRIYIGLHPNAHLVEYDPRTRQLRNLGPMQEADLRLYPRRMAVDKAGWVYAGYGNNVVTAVDPATGQRKVVADERERGSGLSPVFRGSDGAVYARACRNGLSHVDGAFEPWKRYVAGEGEPVDGDFGGRVNHTGPLGFHDDDIQVLEGEPDVPAPQRVVSGSHGDVHRFFPDGTYLEDIDIRSLEPYAEIAPSSDAQSTRRLEFSYEAGGPLLFSLAHGPDGRIYGSTGHPLYVFAFDRDDASFQVARVRGGHFNAMATQAGRVMGALYSSGALHELDPSRPWGMDGANPRMVAEGLNSRAMIRRPYLLEPHINGRHVIMGGYYDSRAVGGGLIIYDVQDEQSTKLSKHDLRPGHNPNAAAVLANGDLVIGTTISMRGRAEEIADEAKLLTIDWQRKQLAEEAVPVPGARSIRELRTGPDGRLLFGIADRDVLFVYDPEQDQLVHKESLAEYGSAAGSQASRMMRLGPDGMFYALFRERILQIDPETYAHRAIGTPPVRITTGIEIVDQRIYFTHESSLWSARLEGLQ